ncbi:MAG TPA: hypothetical protein VJ785_08190, partial [Anaerolineales bacterium]|nr:hypothetical protein [Anaerolineales bacterium]
LYTRLGDGETARRHYREALIPSQKGNTRVGVIFTLEGFASLAASETQWGKAVKLYFWASNLREDSGELRPPAEQASVDRDLALAQEHLSVTEFAILADEGSKMNMEQAIALALEE